MNNNILFFELLPDELIDIIIYKMRYNPEPFTKVSERYKELYNKFLSLINRGIFNPNFVLNGTNMILSPSLYMKDIISRFCISIRSNDKLYINAELMTVETRDSMITYMYKNIDEIDYIYSFIHHSLSQSGDIDVLVAKTRSSNYIYFRKYYSMEHGTIVSFYIHNNWTYFWGEVLSTLTKNYLLYKSKYVFIGISSISGITNLLK
jgi:hypothetical protein